MPFSFDLIKKDPDSLARLGKMITPHGSVNTPAFMPVGTQGTVKAMTPEQIENCGTSIILGNTYHLYLRPGHETVKKLGGLPLNLKEAGIDESRIAILVEESFHPLIKNNPKEVEKKDLFAIYEKLRRG